MLALIPYYLKHKRPPQLEVACSFFASPLFLAIHSWLLPWTIVGYA